MIETARLALRPWRYRDRLPFRDMCRDPQVMAMLGGPLRGRAFEDRLAGLRAADAMGIGMRAVERREDGAFLGYCGLKCAGMSPSPVAGRVEIAWGLAHAHWGHGYALEAARAVLDHASGPVIAFTARANARSWGLMARLGMTRRPDLDFDHPSLAPDDPLRPHIVYEAA